MTTATEPDLPDLADLRVLGTSTTEVWAGANDPVARGLVAWAGRLFGDDRERAVRGALAACKLVIDKYPTVNARRWYVDAIRSAVETWLAHPCREHQENAMKLLDVTRASHAWQAPDDGSDATNALWILEAVDHVGLAVWSVSELSIYITPAPPRTCGARAVGCVFRAMVGGGRGEAAACQAVVAAVAGALG